MSRSYQSQILISIFFLFQLICATRMCICNENTFLFSFIWLLCTKKFRQNWPWYIQQQRVSGALHFHTKYIALVSCLDLVSFVVSETINSSWQLLKIVTSSKKIAECGRTYRCCLCCTPAWLCLGIYFKAANQNNRSMVKTWIQSTHSRLQNKMKN